MKCETPAVGILKQGDFGQCKFYEVACDCTDPDHSHTIEVEADQFGVSVIIYTKTSTFNNKKSRWRQIWDILWKGYSEYETSILLKDQAAMNYAGVIYSAANDVKEFKETSYNESIHWSV